MSKLAALAVGILVGELALPVVAREIVIQTDQKLPAPAEYGLARLSETLRAKGHSVSLSSAGKPGRGELTIVAGLSSGTAARDALRSLKATLPSGPESLVVRKASRQGKPVLILCGADARGLMYAALDAADRVSWTPASGDPIANIHDAKENPYIAERGISMYTMQRAYFESRLYDETHWQRYFDLLARSRINAFTVIFGYENGGFMAPPYPYFFDTPSHPEVRLVGITPEEQARNVKAFKAMMRIAHERGIEVIAAVWDHIYRGGVQSGGIAGASELAGKPTPGLVTGLTAESLAPYTKASLRRFMDVFPEIDGLEFRMHTESGLKREEMEGFWHEVFGMLKQAKTNLKVTLRAKDLPDSIIDDALQQGLNARIETKFWMEQMGLPFHPTHVNRQNQRDRRHGYADLLRYPQRYKVHFRLWSGGTTRMLLWADPDYVRRYAENAKLYDGNSFDVNEMLATKMLGEPHEKPPFALLNEKYRYYDYEFERYWHFYQLWGRLTYNPSTPPEIWQKEFEQRFGAAGPDLMNGMHLASRVLPRIVAAAYRYQLFPTTRGWAEMMRQEDLTKFSDLEGTDIEQFENPRDAARRLLAGTDTSKRSPSETSRWFSGTADQILNCVKRVEDSRSTLSKEARATITDLKILAWLSRYYASRLPAAVSYNLFRETKDVSALDDAIGYERKAVAAWEEIVNSTGDMYSDDLAFGVHRVGFPRNWREESQKLRQDFEQLVAGRKGLQPAGNSRLAELRNRPVPSERQPPAVRLERTGKARPAADFVVTARAQDPSSIKSLRVRYRHLNQTEDYLTSDMSADGKTGVWTARIPGSFITPQWDLMYFVEAIDKAGNGRNYPDLDVETPYVIVPVER